MATPSDVAKWMLEELNRRQDCLYQEQVVHDIESKFGDGFTYTNEDGNQAIERLVLKEFRSLTGDDVVWERSDKLWRKREDHDEAGRSQY